MSSSSTISPEQGWGHKITISVYVEGASYAAAPPILAETVAKVYEDTYGEKPNKVGASVEPVETEPKDQGGS